MTSDTGKGALTRLEGRVYETAQLRNSMLQPDGALQPLYERIYKHGGMPLLTKGMT